MMWRTQAGPIDDDLYLLGHSDVPIYLMHIGEDRYALVEGGLCTDAELLWAQILQVTPAEQIHYWLITHKHYDHCGALALLLPRLPNARVLASQQTYEAWNSLGCRQFITHTNAALCAEYDASAHACLALNQLPVQAVQPGEEVQLSARYALKALPAPGHSPDSVAWYDPRRERLFAGDAVGEYDPVGGQWRPLIFDDAHDYLNTLVSWQQLPIKQLLPGHGGCLVADAAQAIVADILQDCLAFIERHQGVSDAHKRQLATELHRDWAPLSERFVPANLHRASMEMMLTKVAGFSISRKEDVSYHV